MSSLDLNDTFGALLLGTVLSAVLYGVTCLQCWHYFQNYSDPLLVKTAVSSLLILESLHSAFGIHALYYYVILNYTNPEGLLKATWSAASVLIVTTLITGIVHSFYIWRVYIVSRKSIPLPVCLAVLELTCLATGLSIPILALKLQFFADFKTLPKIIIPQDIELSLATVIDIIIAASLTIYLRNSKTGMSGTNMIINRLTVHAINNGIITSLADVLCLTMGIAQKDNLIYLAIFQCVGNLYTNSILATLNARKYIANVPGQSPGLSSMKFSLSHAPSPHSGSPTVMSNSRTVKDSYQEGYAKDVEVIVHQSQLTNME